MLSGSAAAAPAGPDLSFAPAFIDAVFRYASPGTFVALRVFPHDRTQPPPWTVDVRVGEAGKLLAEIRRGIHYSAGTTDPTVFSPAMCTFAKPGTAKTRDIAEGVALIVELDKGDTFAALARLETLLGPATVVVLSGGEWIDAATGEAHSKLHAYWRLSEPTRTEAEHAQLHDARQNAALLAGADPTAMAVVHCFRMPGSLNRKRPDHPVLCTVERINPDAEVHLTDAVETLADAASGAGLNGSGAGQRDNGGSGYQSKRELRAELALIATAMACIPNEAIPDNPDEEYRLWVRWAYAVAGATNGSASGYAVFRTWSAKFTAKHSDAETKALWDRVIAAKPTKIGAGSIFAEASRHGWIDPRRKPKAKKAEATAGKSTATNGPMPGQGASQTPPPTEGGIGGGGGDGGRVPPPGGLSEGADGGEEPEDEQPDPAWDQDGGPDGQGPPPDGDTGPDEDAGAEAGEAEAEAQIAAVPPDDVLNAIAELGSNITRKMLVALFNKRFAVAYEGSRTGVIWFAFDQLLKRDHIERAGFEDFKKMFSNRQLTVSIIGTDGKPKKVTKSFGEWWLEDRDRQQYLGGVTFVPGRTDPIPHTFNLWRNWAVEPKPGDWSLMSNHIHNVICGSRTEVSSYVLRWLARLVQFPAEPGEVAIVVRGLKGVGKTIFGKWLLRLCGQHGLHIHNPVHLTGRFTGHLRDVIFVLADEAFFAGDKEHERILKGIITDDQLLIEPKYRTAAPAANMLHLMMFSNEDWVIPATHDERRYAMMLAAALHVGDFAYFAALDAQMANGGLAAMLHDLLTMDIRDFHPRRSVPDTPELAEQKMHSMDTIHRWWTAVLSRGFVWKSRHGHRDFLKWDEFVTTELLARSYAQWCAENRINYPAHRELLGKRLTAIYPRGRPRKEYPVYEADSVEPQNPQPVVKLGNQMGYKVGTLDNARELFAKAIGRAADTSEWDSPSDC